MLEISLTDNIKQIIKLRKKIEDFKDDFSKNEALVRYALIDPFLRALGWDTEDPDQVKPEYSTDAGRPDYALFITNKEKPRAFVGAKKLGKNEDLNQHISYCVSEGVKFFIATDGNHWELYDTFKEAKVPEKKVIEWDISLDNESKVAIWSLSIANTESFGDAPKWPIFANQDNFLKREQQFAKETYIESKGPLNINRKGNGSRRPVSVIINEEVFNVNKSNMILIETAEWLISHGKITNSTKVATGSHRWLINTEPKHKNGLNFFNPYRLSNGLYLETNYSSERIEQTAKLLMGRFGYTENSIIVKWE